MSKVSFKGGIHPLKKQHEGKRPTAGEKIRTFIESEAVTIPMDMHIGPPSKPVVKKGDSVLIGQVIGEAEGSWGVPVHASISGTVTAVDIRQQLGERASTCVTIQNDNEEKWVPLVPLGDVETIDPGLIIPKIRECGIVGMGGAAFPTHIKLSPPPGKKADVILLNGAECETFLTSDHRLMLESPERVLGGLRAVMRAMGVSRGVIGIEENKPDAIEAIRQALQGLASIRETASIEVVTLKMKYPQGGEKQLIQAVLRREVPSGGLPIDIGAVVLNVGTAAAIFDAVTLGKPLIERVTTVTGRVREPSNLLMRIGTPFNHAVSFCGGYSETPGKIIAGGTMTGCAAPDETVSATKATNGIVVLGESEAKSLEETPCIRCMRCVYACPSGLMPWKMNAGYGRRDYDAMEKDHVTDCILCGACSYVCPARRWLTASFKLGKDEIARRKKG